MSRSGAAASADAGTAQGGGGVDAVSVTIAVVVVVAVMLLWCSKRRRRAVVVPPTGKDKVVPTELPPEVEERRQVNEVMEQTMTATNTKVMFAETKRTESLFQLMQEDDLEEVAKQVNSLDEVSAVMHKAGLEHCNLIFGIDYTGSNYLQGKKTFGGKCLHDISDKIQNPYQSVIATLGETLEPFANDGVIPAFGFGDAYTKDHSVFALRPDRFLNLAYTKAIPSGFKEVLEIYNQLTPKVRLGGPTNFAPLIRQAVDIVKATNKYHILVIVADGQVTNERATTEAIVEASHHPLSIITVGVGDGPWDTMVEFDEKLPIRTFDNFHFVDFARVTKDVDNPSAAFAIQALSEIPDQYHEIKKLGLL
ncbi:copine family protein [Plakobranchus ocellatus]|uniref:Copine family protein n=1 Tax=Plakobranchus ocellatus TaxID=259542 RepID=A0AAV4A265_9GAST|nr:copine family protein [Plakobranchus ocellatus]